MTLRKHSPMHDMWHRRVEGQLRHALNAHPEWLVKGMTDRQRKVMVNSLAKRVVGEIVAWWKLRDSAAPVMLVAGDASGGGDCKMRPHGGEVSPNCLAADAQDG